MSVPLALTLALMPTVASAQRTTAPSPLDVFFSLVGEWEGDAWMIRGPEGRASVRQKEWVETAAGGTVVVVRGLGTLTLPNGTTQDVHKAFAVIHRNHDNTGLMMRAFTGEGFWMDPVIERKASGYDWFMTDPRIGQIRYEMRVDDQGRWVENGYMSRDEGKTWMHFLGMVLVRKQ